MEFKINPRILLIIAISLLTTSSGIYLLLRINNPSLKDVPLKTIYDNETISPNKNIGEKTKDNNNLTKNIAGGYGSQYIIEDRGVFYNSLRVIDADQNTFTYIGAWYGKDATHVFSGRDIIPEADPETIGIVGLFAKDKNHVYWGTYTIPEIDPKTFTEQEAKSLQKPENSKESFDNLPEINRIIIANGDLLRMASVNAVIAKGAEINPLSIDVLSSNICISDLGSEPCYETKQGEVYYKNQKIEADSLTFSSISNGYARDKNYVYYNGKIVKIIDPTTFEIISAHYLKDKNFVYFIYNVPPEEGGNLTILKIIKGSDPKTFQKISEYSGKDANHVYCSDRNIKNADVATFMKIDEKGSLTSIYKDKNYVYDDTCYLMENIDLATFKIIKETAGYYTKDKSHVFFHFSVINQADPETFRILPEYSNSPWMGLYAVDKNHVYYGSKIISNDPSTFKISDIIH